ncbi:MAG TPA: HK97 family phage prohead protease [Tepidisphaeraceae bacterium]|jgi:hypothetical protein
MKTPTTEQIKSEIIRRHKLDGGAEVRVKAGTMDATTDATDPYLITATITTDAMDRDFEAVLPSGCNGAEFLRSGAVFWNHSYKEPPIAKPVGKLMQTDRAIIGKARFAQRPADFVGDFPADYIRALVQQGIIKGVSIGFVPTEIRQPTPKDRERYGNEITRVISKYKLLEWSICGIPSNPEAMIQAAGKGIVAPHIVRDVFGIDCPDGVCSCHDKHVHKVISIPKTVRHVHHVIPAKSSRHDDPKFMAKLTAAAVKRHMEKARGILWSVPDRDPAIEKALQRMAEAQ